MTLRPAAAVAGALPDDIGSILVVLPSWVGDVCMAIPAIRHLRACRKDARVIAFGRPSLRALVDGLPFVDEFIGGSMRAPSVIAEARAIRRRRFGAAIILPNSFRSALFVRACGIAHRAGAARDGRSWLLTVPCADPRTLRTAAQAYSRLAEECTGHKVESMRVELRVTDSERRAAAILLGEPQDAPPERRWILLNPGANREDKRWDPGNFAAAALRIAALTRAGPSGVPIAVTGSPPEASLCAQVAAACGALDLSARGVTLAGLKGVLERTALLVTNDTGPSHMAAGLNTPAITLFGPTDHRWTALAYPLERRLVAEPFLTEDAIADEHPHACSIARIRVTDVVHTADALLARVHRPGEA
ncbi:MAG: glycosyltransferase family 9 protein [Phycisphaerales bacterium]|nr:glycosyltransferase family 9 protein [Phycisphaerales bacterium]